MPWTLNILLHTTTVQDEDAATVIELDMEVENTKS